MFLSLTFFCTDYPYFVGNYSVLFNEYDSYCRNEGGQTVAFEKKGDYENEFNNIGTFLYKWSRTYQKEESLRIEAFYFWTAFNFTEVSSFKGEGGMRFPFFAYLKLECFWYFNRIDFYLF